MVEKDSIKHITSAISSDVSTSTVNKEGESLIFFSMSKLLQVIAYVHELSLLC